MVSRPGKVARKLYVNKSVQYGAKAIKERENMGGRQGGECGSHQYSNLTSLRNKPFCSKGMA